MKERRCKTDRPATGIYYPHLNPLTFQRVSQKPPLPREGEGWGEGAKDKSLILITLILGSGILLRSTSSIHGVVAFSLEGRRDKTFYDTLFSGRGNFYDTPQVGIWISVHQLSGNDCGFCNLPVGTALDETTETGETWRTA